jgi:WD40 repeat protein
MQLNIYWILFILLAFDNAAAHSSWQAIPLEFSNIPTNTSVIDYGMGYAFSHDGRLFASFFSGKADLKDFDRHTSGNIKVWNTQTGQLVYQTVVPNYFNTYHGGRYEIAFSPDDKLLLTRSGEKADFIIWHYAEDKSIKKACQLGSQGEPENVLQFNEINTVFLTKGVNFTKLCNTQNEINLYPISHNTWLENTSTKVLYNNKMLVIYNVRTADIPEPEIQQVLKGLNPENKHFVDFWNLNYVSNANYLLKAIDSEQQIFILFEIFNDKLEINQWSYTSRQWLGKQIFKNLAIKPLEDYESSLYLSNNYLLLRSQNNHLALFKRINSQFTLLWQKNIPNLSKFNKIYFSQDEKFVALDDFTLLAMQTGQMVSQHHIENSIANENFTILVEPNLKNIEEKFNSAFPQWKHYVSNYSSNLSCAANLNSKTNLYSLLANKVIKQIDGLVLDISPDGKTLAVCQGSELFLMHN